jgi:hypothetical protein
MSRQCDVEFIRGPQLALLKQHLLNDLLRQRTTLPMVSKLLYSVGSVK